MVWKTAAIYDGEVKTEYPDYEVSDTGVVRSKADGTVLAVHIRQRDGVQFVIFGQHSHSRRLGLHRLVASTFIVKPPKCKYVRWLDGDKKNVSVSNLGWYMSAAKGGTSRGKPTRVYTDTGEFLYEFDCARDVEPVIGAAATGVSMCCLRKVADYLGLVWRYSTDDEFYDTCVVREPQLDKLIELCKTRKDGTPRCGIRKYSMDGEFLGEFDSAREAMRGLTDTIGSSIPECCKRQCYNAGGFVWRYAYDDELFELTQEERVAIIKARRVVARSRKIRQYAMTGKLVNEYASIMIAQDAVNGPSNGSRVSACCSRTLKTYRGYIWRYADDDELHGKTLKERVAIIDYILTNKGGRSVRQYSKEGVLIAEHHSATSAASAVGANQSSISRACMRLKGYATVKGFMFRYADDDEIKVG